MEHVISIVVPIIFGVIVFVGFIGNALVVLVVAANPQMRNPTNYLIINLAMADLLFIVFCVPFTATDYALSFWPFGDVWCRVVQYLIYVTAYASVYTLVLMSFDRYLAVVHPVASISVRTENNTCWAVAISWIVILVACLPLLMAHGEMGDTNYSRCGFLREDGWSQQAFHIAFFITSFVLPLLLISWLYLTMILQLWKGVTPGGRVSRGKKHVTRMVCIVVVSFAVCWCPIQIVLILKSIDVFEMNHLTVTIQIVSHVLAYTNSCINPILYAFLSDNFRQAFRKVFKCRAIGIRTESATTKTSPATVAAVSTFV